MAVAPYLDDRPEVVTPVRSKTAQYKTPILITIAWLVSLVLAVEIGHWLASGMGFVDHMGHLRDHVWSLITTGSWTPEQHPVGGWLWRVRWG